MSEYQYYEFQAIDRILTEKEVAELRKYSSRARITPARFVNHYNYGDFKGDVEKWMERYFDGFFYQANWGTRRLILRFPRSAVDAKLVKDYCSGKSSRCWTTRTHSLVEFCVEERDSEWIDDDEECLAHLLPLRSEILRSDYRLFYLGWLLAVQEGEVPPKQVEPPVPLGLGALSPALEAFVEIFGLDRKLLTAAAATSSNKLHEICVDDIEPCIAGLSSKEKFDWLCNLALGDAATLQAEFLQHILPESGLEFFSTEPRRMVAEITQPKKRSTGRRR